MKQFNYNKYLLALDVLNELPTQLDNIQRQANEEICRQEASIRAKSDAELTVLDDSKAKVWQQFDQLAQEFTSICQIPVSRPSTSSTPLHWQVALKAQNDIADIISKEFWSIRQAAIQQKQREREMAEKEKANRIAAERAKQEAARRQEEERRKAEEERLRLELERANRSPLQKLKDLLTGH